MSTLFGSTWPTISSPIRVAIGASALPEGEHGRRPGIEVGEQPAAPQHRHDALAEPVGLLEVRVPREDELVEAQVLVLDDAIRDLLVGADERSADAAAHEA